MNRIWTKVIVAGGIFLLLIVLYFLFGSGNNYKSLSQAEAVKVMDSNPDCLIVDVRTQTEYKGGHIPGAICVPLDQIQAGNVDALPDKSQTLLIYCYAGRRSVEAAKALAAMGYTNAYEFGGIVDWSGDTITE